MTSTAEENMRVTFAIYLLNDGATEPTDGTLVHRFSRNFELGGFHRINLERSVKFKAADTDGNGVVDTTDYIVIKGFLLKITDV